MEPPRDAPPEPLLPPEEEAPLASPFRRLSARILDGLLFFVALLPGVLLMLSGEDSPLFRAGILALATGFFGFIAYQLVLLAREGQTLAKRALHLRILNYADDGIPGFARLVVVRELAVLALRLVPVVGALFGLADALFIFGDEHRCIHDLLAGTRVVDESEVAAFADLELI